MQISFIDSQQRFILYMFTSCAFSCYIVPNNPNIYLMLTCLHDDSVNSFDFDGNITRVIRVLLTLIVDV